MLISRLTNEDINTLDINSEINEDLKLAKYSKLEAIVKKKNIMDKDEFCALMRSTNSKQKGLLLHIIGKILNCDKEALQLFLTERAGCGKTYLIWLIMEIYNRFCENDGFFNSYITSALTGKAAVAINGMTVHTVFKIRIGKQYPLCYEIVQQYRSLFRYIKSCIIDECSMISAELNEEVDRRLKQIKINDYTYGGKDMYLIGDLRQLPPI